MDTQPPNDTGGGQEPPTPAGVELGQTLKRWREESNRSQSAVARKLGTRQPTVSRWESGTTLPTVEVIRELHRIHTRPTDAPANDNELARALELHQQAMAERGRGLRPTSTPAPPPEPTAPTTPLPAHAEAGPGQSQLGQSQPGQSQPGHAQQPGQAPKKRTALTILAAAGAAVVLAIAFLTWYFAGSTQAGGAPHRTTSGASARSAPLPPAAALPVRP